MANTWSVLRIAAFLIAAFALYRFIVDWEWIPDKGGWGTGRIAVLLFWAACAYLIDLFIRRVIKNRVVLNTTETALFLSVVGILFWMA